jgi:hypothetical protein
MENLTEHVFNVLASGSAEEKSELLESIRETGEELDIVPLVNALENERDRAVKERIMMVLEHLVPRSNFSDAERMIRSPDPFVRNGIVEIIRHNNIPIINFLEKLAEDDDKDVRKFVIDALSQEKSERAIDIIRDRLEDPEINIRYTAIEYLGNFRDTQSAANIESALLKTNNFMLICSGLEALAKIKHSPGKNRIFKKFSETNDNPAMTFPFLKYIGAFGTSDSFTYIENLMDKQPEVYAKELIDAIEGIITNNRLESIPDSLRIKLENLCRKTQNTVNKYALTKLLVRTAPGKEDRNKQLENVRIMLKDQSEMVQLSAVEVLAEIGDSSDVQRLEELAENTESDELLEAVGDAVMKIQERDQ